jgi:hypothetical protein
VVLEENIMPDPVNLPMECLCCLPKSPYVARVREIAEDLGVTIGAVKVAIASLSPMFGAKVCWSRPDGEYCANVAQDAYSVVAAMGGEYWRKQGRVDNGRTSILAQRPTTCRRRWFF